MSTAQYAAVFAAETRRISEQCPRRRDVGDYIQTFVVIKSFANGHSDSCFPKQTTLAERLGLTARTVRNHIARLQEWGVLAVRRTRSNHYYFPLDPRSARRADVAETGDGDGQDRKTHAPSSEHRKPHVSSGENRKTHGPSAKQPRERTNYQPAPSADESQDPNGPRACNSQTAGAGSVAEKNREHNGGMDPRVVKRLAEGARASLGQVRAQVRKWAAEHGAHAVSCVARKALENEKDGSVDAAFAVMARRLKDAEAKAYPPPGRLDSCRCSECIELQRAWEHREEERRRQSAESLEQARTQETREVASKAIESMKQIVGATREAGQ